MQGGAGSGTAKDAGGAHVLLRAVLAVGGAGGERCVCAAHDRHLRATVAPAAHRAALCVEGHEEEPAWPGARPLATSDRHCIAVLNPGKC